jgi:hypothetical protein
MMAGPYIRSGDYYIYAVGSVPTKRSEDLGMTKDAEPILHIK